MEAEAIGKRKLIDAKTAAEPLETQIVRLQYAHVDGGTGGSSGGGGSMGGGSSSATTPSSLSGGSSGGGFGSSGGASGGSGLRAILLGRMSSRGCVETDPRTNSLIITDVRENLDAAMDMVAQLDRPERQVEIELRIVHMNSDLIKDR